MGRLIAPGVDPNYFSPKAPPLGSFALAQEASDKVRKAHLGRGKGFALTAIHPEIVKYGGVVEDDGYKLIPGLYQHVGTLGQINNVGMTYDMYHLFATGKQKEAEAMYTKLRDTKTARSISLLTNGQLVQDTIELLQNSRCFVPLTNYEWAALSGHDEKDWIRAQPGLRFRELNNGNNLQSVLRISYDRKGRKYTSTRRRIDDFVPDFKGANTVFRTLFWYLGHEQNVGQSTAYKEAQGLSIGDVLKMKVGELSEFNVGELIGFFLDLVKSGLSKE